VGARARARAVNTHILNSGEKIYRFYCTSII